MTALFARMMLADLPFQEFWFGPAGQSELAGSVERVYMYIFYISMFFFILLMGLMVYFVIVYRRRPGVPSPRSVSHNTPLELFWSVVPLIIFVFMFFWGFTGYMQAVVSPSNAEVLNLTAQKWSWSITYPNGAQSKLSKQVASKQQPVFVVPADTNVLLQMSSIDVIHSFWVPNFRTKFDVFPNRYTAYRFKADPITEADELDEEGGYRYRDHYIFCAEYCGDMHSEMAATLRVVSKEDYKRIVQSWLISPDAPPIEWGEYVWRGKCASCHTIDGSTSVGPTWKNMFGYEKKIVDGPNVIADENYIRESILNPMAKLVEGFPQSMPTNFSTLRQQELDGLMAFIKSLSDRAPKSLLDDGGAGATDGGGD